MKKEYRVKESDEFQKIMRGRRFHNSKSYSLYIEERKENHARFGISVPKKLGNAVLRNKTKRQVRSMLQHLAPYDGKYDVIIIVRKGYFSKSYDDNEKDLEKLMKTVKM